MKSKVLITGASGFIGRAACAAFHQIGWHVRGTARRPNPVPEADEWSAGPDLGAEADWTKLVDGIDCVVHLAGLAHALLDRRDEGENKYRQANTEGTAKLAEDAARAGVRRFIFVSSIGVNGPSTRARELFAESSTPRPHNAYARSKWSAEHALMQIGQRTGMQIVIVRPPLVYGPGAPGNLARLYRWVASGLPLPLKAATQPRSMVFVYNLTSALTCLAQQDTGPFKLYLVSDDQEASTVDLIRTMARELGQNDRVWFCPRWLLRLAACALGRSRDYDRLFCPLRVDSSKIRSELGWRPPYTLEEGIRMTTQRWKRPHR